MSSIIFFSCTGCILVGKQLFLCVSCMLVCSLCVPAVQGKTHKGAFAIIFFICRDLLNCLWNTCTNYIIIPTYKTVNYSSNSIKINLSLLRLMQSRPGHQPKFQVNIKIQLNAARVSSNIKIQLNAARVSRLSFRFLWLWRDWQLRHFS